MAEEDRLPLASNATDIAGNRKSYDAVQQDNEALHCHDRSHEEGSVDQRARKKLIFASILCLIFMIIEASGGAVAKSLAIMTDAAHLLTDFASFMISLFAIYMASRPATKSMSFGWHRAEVVGAMISVLMIWVVTGVLVYLAIMRIVDNEYEINGKIMLITSGIGVVVNIIMGIILHQHGHTHGGMSGHGHSQGLSPTPPSTADVTPASSGRGTPTPGSNGSSQSHGFGHENAMEAGHGHSHGHGHGHGHSHGGATSMPEAPRENINVRAAFIHVIGDFLQSIGVLVAAIAIYVNPQKNKIADPICTFIFSVLVLFTTINILRDTINVIMEGTPKGLDFNEVKTALQEIPGVAEVHNLRMWSLTVNKTAMSAHLAIVQGYNTQKILKKASRIVKHRFKISEVTIQLEDYVEEMADCKHCSDPVDD